MVLAVQPGPEHDTFQLFSTSTSFAFSLYGTVEYPTYFYVLSDIQYEPVIFTFCYHNTDTDSYDRVFSIRSYREESTANPVSFYLDTGVFHFQYIE